MIKILQSIKSFFCNHELVSDCQLNLLKCKKCQYKTWYVTGDLFKDKG